MKQIRLRRWIVASLVCGFAFAAVSFLILQNRAPLPAPGGTSHLLAPNQWGFGSGAQQSVYYTNGAPSRIESYAFQKHGYYEVRYPCSKSTPCQ